jgi:hypothetical protein
VACASAHAAAGCALAAPAIVERVANNGVRTLQG